ncbi:MAG: hypothetical protein WA655_24370 [Candidatus Korobacteraceae bacterium]
MKRAFWLIAFVLLALAVAAGQSPAAPDRSWQNRESATQQNASVVRGCLSGSAGNFTITDQNGMQFRLLGDVNALEGKVGHEIEITGSESQAEADESVAQSPSSFQVSNVRDIASSCRPQRDGSAPPPAENTPPDKG